MSIFSWIAIAIAVMIPIIFGSRHKCEHGKKSFVFALLAVLVILGGVMSFFVWVRPAPPQVAWAYVEEGGEIKLSEHAKTAVPTAADPTLEVLWEKLTKARINLDEEALPKPVDDSKDEAVKEAVGETFGLDKDGKLPPDWVITPPKQVGSVYRVSVASDPFVTEEECRRQLEQEQLPQTVANRMRQIVKGRVGYPIKTEDPLPSGIGLDYIFREICRDQFTTTVDSPSVGEMKKVHVLLEFNPHTDEHLLQAWTRSERQQRLASFSKIAALSLTGLAAVYGLLRFDTWSKGYYSRELLVGSVLAIIAIAVVVIRS
jgi:hypothetical protein